MTACPYATWDPLGPQTAHRMDAHDIVVLHTMAGPFNVVHDMFHANGYRGTESHFGVRGDGYAEQWQDLDYRADANNEGNRRCISIETADMGPWVPGSKASFPKWSTPDVPAWTEAQLDKIVALVGWCCDRYDIPKELIPDSKPGRRGIGYHRQGIPGNFPPPYRGWVPGGELWTVLPGGRGKPCPGDRRIRQLIEIVIPRVRGEKEDEMPLTEDEWQRLSNLVDGRLRDPENLDVITDATLAKLNTEAFKKSGSPYRTSALELSKRGVNEALGAADGDASDGLLAGEFDTVNAKLDALAPPVEPEPPVTP